MLATTRVEYRRAIEALRAGVPNRDAVGVLGGAQPRIEERFRQQLEAAKVDFASGRQTPGLLISGGFGSGKSHMLEYMKHLALEENFVCSKIVISKETPIHDPTKLYRAAIQSAVVPGKTGSALNEIVAGLPGVPGYADLSRLVSQGDLSLNSRFAATLFLFERVNDPEIRDRIVSFWSGDPLGVGVLRKWLRAYGEAATYDLEHVTAGDLFLQRFRFTPQLIIAAGYSGWVLLIDELELVARYSLRQRARSYAELARWMGRIEGESIPGLTAVLAITSDYAANVLEARNDLEYVPGRLRAWGLSSATDSLVAQAEQGMRLIARAVPLREPTPQAVVEESCEQVRRIYAQAYGWEPPALKLKRRESSTSMRQHVRRWITEWDLRRLYPEYTPSLISDAVSMDYHEDPVFQTPSEGDEDGSPGSGGGGA